MPTFKQTEIQTIIFDKKVFTLAQARKWLKDHGFKTTFGGKGVDEKPNSFRFRQRNPGDFQKGSFRTISLPGTRGIKAVIGRPKSNKASHPVCPPGRRLNPRTGRCETIARVKKTEDILKSLGQSLVLRSSVIVADQAGIVINGAMDQATQKLIEKWIGALIPEEHLKSLSFHDGPAGHHIPLFDLAIVPSHTRRLVKHETQVFNRLEAIENGILDPSDVELVEKREVIDDETLIKLLSVEKAEEDKQIVLGIVLEPNEVDAHEDTVKPATIEKAAHIWLAQFQNRGVMHRKIVNSRIEIFESYVTPVAMTIGGQKVKKGSWLVMYHILDKGIWKKIKDGEFRGFSMGGFARRVKLRGD